tara:strand:+ start:894 stop:1313 length:420 start_codon:yes stop_codon:yes gene_type:complete
MTITRERKSRRRARSGCSPFYKREDRLSTLKLKEIYFDGNQIPDCTECAYCGLKSVSYEIDHWIAIAQGGSNRRSNLVVSCMRCNRSKSYLFPTQWLAKLKNSRDRIERRRYTKIVQNHKWGKKRLSKKIHRIRDSLER